jgi:phage gp36-like protein
MAYLLPEELYTHVYYENMNDITRDNYDIVRTAIESAIDEAKSYLGRFDLLKIFGNMETEPVHIDANLKSKVKDLTLWQLVTLGQTNIKIELARTKYEDAVRWFEKVSEHKINPGLPMPGDNADTGTNESGSIDWNSLPKRNNHY